MLFRSHILIVFMLAGSVIACMSQSTVGIPLIKPAGLGLGNAFKVPTLKDFNQFGNG